MIAQELELRMGSGGEFLLEHLESVTACLQCPCNLFAQTPIRSTVRYHDTSDLRCISFGTTAFWERKSVLAVAKLPIVGFGRGAWCKLVASRERNEARPHNADIHDSERWRARYSCLVQRNWRMDLTIVDEYRFTVEYEYVAGRIPPASQLTADIQTFLSQWAPVNLLLSGIAAGMGPDFCLVRVRRDILNDPPTLVHELERCARAAPQPVSLTRQRLDDIVSRNPHAWAASAKLDGIRALVWMDAIFSTTCRTLLYLPRLKRIYVLPAPNSTATLCRKGPLVLDVELFWNEGVMVAFDCLLHEGAFLCESTPYGERFGLAQALANRSEFAWPLRMKSKRLWPLSRAADAVASTARNDGVILHELDGNATFKWKPHHTIDLKAVDNKRVMCLSDRTEVPAVRPKGYGIMGKNVVWECKWDGKQAVPFKIRTDKKNGNSKATFDDICQATQDDIQLRELCLG